MGRRLGCRERKCDFEWYYYILKNLLNREYRVRLGLAGASLKKMKKIAGRNILSLEATNQLIAEKIQAGVPFMAGRFGATELNTVISVLRVNKFPHIDRREYFLEKMYTGAGFFPKSVELEGKFAELMLKCCQDIDLLGVWQLFMEDYIIKKYAMQTQVTKIDFLSPWEMRHVLDCKVKPWSHALAGKRVLVVHPFESSIKEQYKNNREHIFEKIYPAENILPEFELKTIKAVQTLSGENTESFYSWFEALEYMVEQCKKQEFDVAIIGCGAYGFPLASEIKRMGKIAIHLGGNTQLLFGIKGKRWVEYKTDKIKDEVFNNYWIWPTAEETPKNASKVEGGCYW